MKIPLQNTTAFLELGNKYGADHPLKKILALMEANGCDDMIECLGELEV